MVVESNVELQNIFRERLKISGYRVLVTQDPERALARFVEDVKTADCVMFCAGGLGEPALEAFNRFGEDSVDPRDSGRAAVGRQAAGVEIEGQARQAPSGHLDAGQAARATESAGQTDSAAKAHCRNRQPRFTRLVCCAFFGEFGEFGRQLLVAEFGVHAGQIAVGNGQRGFGEQSLLDRLLHQLDALFGQSECFVALVQFPIRTPPC